MDRFNVFSCYDIILLVDLIVVIAAAAAAKTANCFDAYKRPHILKMRFIIVFEFVFSNLHVYLKAKTNKTRLFLSLQIHFLHSFHIFRHLNAQIYFFWISYFFLLLH